MTKELSVGEWVGRAESWDFEGTAEKPVLVIHWKITLEAEQDLPDGTKKPARYARLTFQRLYFTPAAVGVSVRALAAMGWEGDDLGELRASGGGLGDREVTLVLEMEPEWTDESGKKTPAQLRVRWINPLGGPKIKGALSQDDAKKMGASMRGVLQAARAHNAEGRKGAGAKAPRAAASFDDAVPVNRPARTDDDIPF